MKVNSFSLFNLVLFLLFTSITPKIFSNAELCLKTGTCPDSYNYDLYVLIKKVIFDVKKLFLPKISHSILVPYADFLKEVNRLKEEIRSEKLKRLLEEQQTIYIIYHNLVEEKKNENSIADIVFEQIHKNPDVNNDQTHKNPSKEKVNDDIFDKNKPNEKEVDPNNKHKTPNNENQNSKEQLPELRRETKMKLRKCRLLEEMCAQKKGEYCQEYEQECQKHEKNLDNTQNEKRKSTEKILDPSMELPKPMNNPKPDQDSIDKTSTQKESSKIKSRDIQVKSENSISEEDLAKICKKFEKRCKKEEVEVDDKGFCEKHKKRCEKYEKENKALKNIMEQPLISKRKNKENKVKLSEEIPLPTIDHPKLSSTDSFVKRETSIDLNNPLPKISIPEKMISSQKPSQKNLNKSDIPLQNKLTPDIELARRKNRIF